MGQDRLSSRAATLNGAGKTQMSTIALIDTRLKTPGQSIGTVISTHDTIRAAFKAKEVFQKLMRNSGVKDHVPTKIKSGSRGEGADVAG
jgi:hypothetical protein